MEKWFDIREGDNHLYFVFYRVGRSYCKRLDYAFLGMKQAAACVLMLEAWLSDGGRLNYSGEPDEPGLVTGFDSSTLVRGVVTSVELLQCLLTEGLCPMEVAQHLLGLSEEELAPYRVRMVSGCAWVDLASWLQGLVQRRAEAELQRKVEEVERQQRIDNLDQRLMLHHRSLMMTTLVESSIEGEEQRRMFLQYLHGYPMNVIAEQYKVSYFYVRKQIAQARKQFESQLYKLLTAKEQLAALSVDLLQAKEELKALHACFLVRQVANVRPRKLDPSFYDWATFTLKHVLVSLDEFPFSLRAARSLEQLGVQRVDQLLALNFQRLRDLPNIGSKTCAELEDFIHDHKLDALQHPAVLEAFSVMAEEGLQEACKRYGMVKVVKTDDGFVLNDLFDKDEDIDKVLGQLYSHPSVLFDSPYLMGGFS